MFCVVMLVATLAIYLAFSPCSIWNACHSHIEIATRSFAVSLLALQTTASAPADLPNLLHSRQSTSLIDNVRKRVPKLHFIGLMAYTSSGRATVFLDLFGEVLDLDIFLFYVWVFCFGTDGGLLLLMPDMCLGAPDFFGVVAVPLNPGTAESYAILVPSSPSLF